MTAALTWSFPDIAQDGATMRMRWGTLEIDMDVAVESLVPDVSVTSEVAARYVGTWRLEPLMPNPETGKLSPPATVTVKRGAGGALLMSVPPGAFGPPRPPAPSPPTSGMTPQERERAEARHRIAQIEGGTFEYALLPRAHGIFMLGWLDDDGVLLDVERVFHEFELENGRAVRLVIRAANDMVIAKGTREK